MAYVRLYLVWYLVGVLSSGYIINFWTMISLVYIYIHMVQYHGRRCTKMTPVFDMQSLRWFVNTSRTWKKLALTWVSRMDVCTPSSLETKGTGHTWFLGSNWWCICLFVLWGVLCTLIIWFWYWTMCVWIFHLNPFHVLVGNFGKPGTILQASSKASNGCDRGWDMPPVFGRPDFWMGEPDPLTKINSFDMFCGFKLYEISNMDRPNYIHIYNFTAC